MVSAGQTRLIRKRYEVLETVGSGGQGTVVKARDTRHDRIVALKIRRLPADDHDAQQTLAEVRILLQLPPHRGLPIARDDFYEDDNHIVVLDWVDGIDLGRVLSADGTPGLPLPTVLRWAAQAAEALAHLHQHDPPIVHGDVKPSNLVLDRHGSIVCVDYGVSSLPARVQRGGTPGFRAPELGSVGIAIPTPAADVYGLAATVFALLTGSPPRGILPDWTEMSADVAARLETAIRRGLSIDPARRPPSVGAFVEGLAAADADAPPTGTVTVLSTGIVDAIALWERHPLSMPGVLARHEVIVDRVVGRHGGVRIAGPLEDGTTVSLFERATLAVQAAIALNDELVGVLETSIQIRSGIHTGEIVSHESRGPVVNRATAIRSLAEGGQVLLSRATTDVLDAGRVENIGLIALGRHRLPGFDQPEPITAVAAAGLDVPPDPTVSPYPGLAPFGLADADVYMGRDETVVELRAMIADGGVVAVLGPSGAGKSSLILAGVVPHLADPLVLTAGADVAADLQQAGDRVVVIDQLDAVLATCADMGARREVCDLLCDHPAGVIVAVRTDEMAALSRFPRLAEQIAANHLLVTPMRPDQLRTAIEQPALSRGLELDPGLIDLVLAETGDEPGSLPLVAHAMRETWVRREGRTLTVAGYKAAGGVSGAIAHSAERVFTAMSPDDRELLRAIVLRMVHPGDGGPDMCRRVDIAELSALGDSTLIARILGQLTEARLVIREGESVQPAHDALLRAWPRLAEWIAEQRDDMRRQRHLTIATRAWVDSGLDTTELYRGARLAAATELGERSALTGTERDFIDTSILVAGDEQRRMVAANRRLRRLLTGVAVALVLAVVASVVAVVQRNRADDATATSDVTRLAAEARAAATASPDLALLLGVEAERRLDSRETRSALLDVLAANPQLVAKLHGVTSGLESVVWSPDGSLLVAPTSDSVGTLIWDGSSFAPSDSALTATGGFHLDFDATFTPDGESLLVAGVVEQRSDRGVESSAATLQAWDMRARTLRSTIPLAVVPDHVVAIDASHALVIGMPVPTLDALDDEDTSMAMQRVDIVAGTTDDRTMLVANPLVSGASTNAVFVLSSDGTLSIVNGTNAATPRVVELGSLLGPEEVPTGVAVDPSGSRLAIGTESGDIVLADLPLGDGTPSLIRRITSTGDPSSVITFSPDGSLFATGGYLGSTRIFLAESGASFGVPLTASNNLINDLAFSPDGRRLAAGGLDGTGSVWSLDGSRMIGRPITGHSDAVVAALATPDGSLLVTAGFDGIVLAQETATHAPRWSTDLGEPIVSAALDPGGTRVAVGTASGQLRVIDLTNGASSDPSAHFDGVVAGIAWSSAEPLLAVAVIPPVEPVIAAVDFVDPKTLAVVRHSDDISGGSPMAVAFAPDGRRLAVVATNNMVHLIDVASGALDARFIESVDAPFTSVAWSPKGDRLATGADDGTVDLWNATTLQRATPAGRVNSVSVSGVAFSKDGSLLASTSAFAVSQLWRTDTGAAYGAPLVGGDPPITAELPPPADRPSIPFVPSFSPDGNAVYTGSDHPMEWSLDPATWIVAACAIAGRELTTAESARFMPAESQHASCGV